MKHTLKFSKYRLIHVELSFWSWEIFGHVHVASMHFYSRLRGSSVQLRAKYQEKSRLVVTCYWQQHTHTLPCRSFHIRLQAQVHSFSHPSSPMKNRTSHPLLVPATPVPGVPVILDNSEWETLTRATPQLLLGKSSSCRSHQPLRSIYTLLGLLNRLLHFMSTT